jgi:hypothetical protein
MDTALSEFLKLACGCPRKSPAGTPIKSWTVRSRDRRVNALPSGSRVIHDCPKLSVGQKMKGINRYYISRDPSIIIK